MLMKDIKKQQVISEDTKVQKKDSPATEHDPRLLHEQLRCVR